MGQQSLFLILSSEEIKQEGWIFIRWLAGKILLAGVDCYDSGPNVACLPVCMPLSTMTLPTRGSPWPVTCFGRWDKCTSGANRAGRQMRVPCTLGLALLPSDPSVLMSKPWLAGCRVKVPCGKRPRPALHRLQTRGACRITR